MNEPRPLIIADFDHTLFETERFKNDYWQLLDRLGLERSFTFTPEELQTLDTAILESEDYLFPDARGFLEQAREHDLKLVTTGDQTWQAFKIAFVPLLSDIHQTILPGNKGEYIRDHILPKLAGELHFVDDLEENLLPLVDSVGVNLWQIQRPGSQHPDHRPSKHPRIRVIDTLDKIQVEKSKN
jgi:hypothetical protein